MKQRQIVIRKLEICRNCKAVNSFRLLCGFRDIGGTRQAYARCTNCGEPVHVRISKISDAPLAGQILQ